MEREFQLKQLLVNKVLKARLLKIIKVPQEPVQEIINSIYKIEIEEVFLKGTNLEIDSKVSLHIVYIPQGIGEFKRTFSVSFNFFQEFTQEFTQELGESLWPRVTAKIDKLVIKPKGKNLQVLLYITTEVLVMGLKEYRLREEINYKEMSLINLGPLVLEHVISAEDVTIHKEFTLPLEDNSPWRLEEVYLEGINYSYAKKEKGLEILIKILAKIRGLKDSNQKLQSQYQLLEFSWEKTLEGWESQRGLSVEPHFYQISSRVVNGLTVVSFGAKVTLLTTINKLLKVHAQDQEAKTKLIIEKPVLRQREVLELEREIFIDSGDWQLRPEVFVKFPQNDLAALEGLICLKAKKAVEFIPFKITSTFVKKPNLHTMAKARVKIKKVEQMSKKKIKCSLQVIIDLLGSEIINL